MESDEQICVVRWFRIAYPEYRLIGIPNGMWAGGSSRKGKFGLIAKMKAEGLTPGVSDLFLPLSRGGFHGLWVEMKDKGKTWCSVSIEQRKWISDMLAAGYYATWAAGAAAGIKVIKNYMELDGK